MVENVNCNFNLLIPEKDPIRSHFPPIHDVQKKNLASYKIESLNDKSKHTIVAIDSVFEKLQEIQLYGSKSAISFELISRKPDNHDRKCFFICL